METNRRPFVLKVLHIWMETQQRGVQSCAKRKSLQIKYPSFLTTRQDTTRLWHVKIIYIVQMMDKAASPGESEADVEAS